MGQTQLEPVENPRGIGVVARFDACVAEAPDAPAVAFEGRSLCYRELREQSVAVADAVQRAVGSAGPDTGTPVLVPVICERSLSMPAAFLGAARAGVAYVPVDPRYPEHRIRAMLEDSDARVCLVDRENHRAVAAMGRSSIVLEDAIEDAGRVSEECADEGFPELRPDSLVYVIYTSGSTGKPKGVMVHHAGLDNLIESFAAGLGIEPGERILSLTTPCFDIFALELFLPLCTGATVVMASREDALSGARLAALLVRERIDTMQATPAGWRLLLQSGWQGEPSLRALIGGEALPPALARELGAKTGSLFNLYGPTETTIWSAVWEVPRDFEEVSIGVPILNTELLVVDEALEPVEEGEVGELLIGGAGVAAGYHARPVLTRERFVDHPQLGRAYRTGDLARFDAEGLLYFHGRVDHQVKIRGFRVELGDIESALAEQPAVGSAAVVVRGEDERRSLVAFVAPREGCEVAPAELLAGLREKLPAYMVPSQVVVLPALPLTPNRKVDRALLTERAQTAREASQSESDGDDACGFSELEAIVAGAMQVLLGGPRPGLDDDFFDLGGHSLLAFALAEGIEAESGVLIDPVDVFRTRTVRGIAALVADARAGAASSHTLPSTVECFASGRGAPMVFVGSTREGAALAGVFRAERTIIGLNLFGIYEQVRGQPKHSLSVEHIAEVFVDHLTQFLPEGPYALCSYCDDAKVAWAIADLLEARGASVPYFGVIDPEWLVNLHGARPGAAKRLAHSLRTHGVGFALRKSLSSVRARAQGVVHRHQRGSRRAAEDDASTIDNHHGLYGAYLHAMDRWTAPEQPARDCYAYFSSDWHLTAPTFEEVRWVHWRPVHGIHQKMFDPPAVEQLAEVIEADMTRCLELASWVDAARPDAARAAAPADGE